jgi:hypothetical protein
MLILMTGCPPKNWKQSQKKDDCPTVQQTAKKAEQKRFAFPKKKEEKLVPPRNRRKNVCLEPGELWFCFVL